MSINTGWLICPNCGHESLETNGTTIFASYLGEPCMYCATPIVRKEEAVMDKGGDMPERIGELLDGSAYEKFVSESLSLPPSVISYCEKCDRFFDVRSGCEADIRDDERSNLKEQFNIQFSLSSKHGTGK